MASYPPVLAGKMALYPVRRNVSMGTGVRRASNGSEQRWVSTAKLNEFTLAYSGLYAADRDLIVDFFDSVKGGFDSTWDITLLGTLYEYMTFVESVIKATEAGAESWSVKVKMRQVRSSGLPVVPPPASFPTLEGGFRTYRQWFYDHEFTNRIVDMDSGKRWAYNVTPTPRLAWQVGGDSLPDTDVPALLDFAIGVSGEYRTFQFTDPETLTVHPKCRLEDDGVDIDFRGPNQNAIRMNVVEVV